MADIGDPGDEESLSHGMERAAGQRASQHHSRTRKKKETGKKHKPHHAKRPAEHRASVGAGSARGGVPRTPPRGRTGEPLIDLVAGSHSHAGGGRVSAGLGGVLLELAGEGAIRAGDTPAVSITCPVCGAVESVNTRLTAEDEDARAAGNSVNRADQARLVRALCRLAGLVVLG